MVSKNKLQFKAESTWKLYQLLKHDWVEGSLEVELDELRILLGLEDMYPQWKDFQKRIIKAIEEINNISDIAVSYERIKDGRNVSRLVFRVSLNIKATHYRYINI